MRHGAGRNAKIAIETTQECILAILAQCVTCIHALASHTESILLYNRVRLLVQRSPDSIWWLSENLTQLFHIA